jgi:hypothetical protein
VDYVPRDQFRGGSFHLGSNNIQYLSYDARPILGLEVSVEAIQEGTATLRGEISVLSQTVSNSFSVRTFSTSAHSCVNLVTW